MDTGIKHLHVLIVVLFVLQLIYKLFLLAQKGTILTALEITFKSIGAGIDGAGLTALGNFLENKGIAFNKEGFGKEGEQKISIDFAKIPTSVKASLAADIGMLKGGQGEFSSNPLIDLNSSKADKLDVFSAKTKIPHIILASLMVLTGVFLLFRSPSATAPFMIVKLLLVFGSIPISIIAMKKKKLIPGLVGLLMLLYAFAISKVKDPLLRSEKARIEAANENPDSLSKGETIYKVKCTLCHGEDGKMGFQGAKNLQESTLDDGGMTDIIRNGKGMMPPNSEKDLSDEDIKSLIEYVRSLE